MELKIPTAAELRMIYQRDLRSAFPPEELKPLSHMETMWRKGRYQPWCLFEDGGTIAGECFLWLGDSWALLDYLCVPSARRNSGLGSLMLEKMRALESDRVGILVESEAPDHASDATLARRRLGFYERNGARLAGYDTELFGVHYKTLYWAEKETDDRTLLREHRRIYQVSFLPEKFARYVQIPKEPDALPSARNV